MDILLIASTEAEIAPLIKFSANRLIKQINGIYEIEGYNLSICITGVGGVATTYNLTRQLASKKYDLVIQAGIAGSYNYSLSLGDIVLVDSEVFADLGADDNGTFLDVFSLGLVNADDSPFSSSKMYMSEHKYIPQLIPAVSGITINTTTGSQNVVTAMKARHNPDIESMEGAAFFYTCIKEGIPFVQIRAISNYVEPRDKSKWNIPLSVKNLNIWLVDWLGLNS
jgi:futalosine hydrolase